MGINQEGAYLARERRINDAIQLKIPDRIPAMLELSYFPAKYTGITCEAAYYDYEMWLKVLRRCSHNHRLTWARMERLIHRWLPLARVCHPYLLARFGVITKGRSPVR